MFSFGEKKEKEELADWTSGDETGMFHTMQDDIKLNSAKSGYPVPDVPEKPKNYLESQTAPDVSLQPKKDPIVQEGASPFLGSNRNDSQKDFRPAEPARQISQPKILAEKEAETPDQYLTSSLKLEGERVGRSFSWVKTLFIISAILLAAGAFFWGYTIWMERQNDGIAETEQLPVENNVTENKPPEPIIEEIPEWPNKFSTTTPNYWIIPIETVTADGMSKILNDKAAEAAKLNSGDLAEFLITDSNNNPVSFSAFCILSGISLPSQIFESLEDSFSFYFYRDGSYVKAGLSVKTKNSDKIVPLLSASEKDMPVNLKPLLLGVVSLNKTFKFSDSKYKNHSIRFINLDDNKTSIDYSVSKTHLVVATSMLAGRAILDKTQP